MRYIKTGVLLLVCSVLITGCGSGKKLSLADCTDTTILIHKDGSVDQVIVEAFDESYYDKEELKNFINTQVDAYNTQNKDHKMKASSLKEKGKNMKIKLEYDSLESYASFNSVTADTFGVEKASEIQIIPDTFVSVLDSKTVDSSEITGNSKYQILYINDDCNIRMEAKMKYYSGAVVLNNTTVQTTSGEPAVIVYE
ncbi:MAG: hypothetical protein PUB10_03380 [Clostridiales bacterium]|nr:hypothetical protein [Clostridiales bacterium]